MTALTKSKKNYLVRLDFTTNFTASQKKILVTRELEESYFKGVLKTKNKYNVDAQVSSTVTQIKEALTDL